MQKKEEILRNKEKVLGEENKNKNKREWLYALSGTDTDVIRFISMMTINPGLVVLFVYYVSAVELNIPLTYLAVDALILLWWWRKALKRKKWIEEERDIDRTEIIHRKIEELREIEERVKQQK